MIRVGFFYHYTETWMGGVNYIKNLLFALAAQTRREIEPYVFASSSAVAERLGRFATVIETKALPMFALGKVANRLERELTGSSRAYNDLLKDHRLDIVSHSGLFGRTLPCRSINWIPDFQHYRMPALFPLPIKLRRNIQYFRIIKNSTRVMLSSRAALNDLERFTPDYGAKARVVHFVSQPDMRAFSVPADLQKKELAEQFGITDNFFYLPNQFWAHKNHLAVWRAIRELKKSGVNAMVVCTGFPQDYRNRGFHRYLLDFLRDNGMEKNIKILGLIDYQAVMALFRNAVSILNPSLFEGWSSTVEEAKSLGVHCILSDIPVHREQDASGAWYFDPRDYRALAALLERRWKMRSGLRPLAFGDAEQTRLRARTAEFAGAYRDLAIETMNAR
jgi:hypothetical protein